MWRVVFALCALAVVMGAYSASSAVAAGIRPGVPSLSHGPYGTSRGAVVDKNGYLYASEGGSVHVFDTTGAEVLNFTTSLGAPALSAPAELAVDAAGILYVHQTGGGAVYKFIPSDFPPVSTSTYGLDTSLNETSPGANDGNGILDPAANTRGLAVDPGTGDVFTSHAGVTELQSFAAGFTGMTDGVTTFTISGLPAACDNDTTAAITYSSTGGTRRDNIDNALEAACTGAAPQSGTATNGGDFRVATTGTPAITFQGQLANQNFDLLTCTPVAGSCPITANTEGVPSKISQYHADGTLVTGQIASGFTAAEISGIDVYSTNGRIFAFDGVGGRVGVFNSGGSSPISTFDGSTTPDGSIGARILGTILTPSGLAVDQATGHIFVFDTAHSVVDEFKANGDYVTRLTNSFTISTTPVDVAVDNSGAANDGTIYVVDKDSVDAFGPMSTDDLLTLSALKDGPGSGTITGGSAAEPDAIDCGTTCDASFDPGTEVTLIATPAPGSQFVSWSGCDSLSTTTIIDDTCTITVNENDAVTATFIKRTLTVTKSGPGAGTITSDPAGIDCGTTCSGDFDDGEEVVLTPSADADSKLFSWTGCDSLDEETDECTVTMSSDRSVNANFAIEPVISDTKATGVGATTASLNARVNPRGSETGWHFEYVPNAEYLAKVPNEHQTIDVDATDGNFTLGFDPDGDDPEPEQVTVGIKFDATAAELRSALVGLPSIGDDDVVVTGGPGGAATYTVTFQGALENTNVAQLAADPSGLIGGGQSVDVATANDGGHGYDDAIKDPVPDGSAGAGSSDFAVSRQIVGLMPSTTYRFRLVAGNFASPDGGTNGAGATFTTYQVTPGGESCDNDDLRTGPSAKLPDCRAYEQASPVDKNGQEAHGFSSRMAASDDGESVLYFALNGQMSGGGPQGFPYYVAHRADDQWSAQAVLPPLAYGDSGGPRGWFPDLSTIFLGAGSLSGAGENFLARSSDGGALTTISTGGSNATFVGASADGSVVYFSGSSPLTSDAVAGKNNVYAWDRDTNTLVLAGVLPDSSCGSPPCKPAGGSAVRVGDPGAGPFDNSMSNYPVETHAVSDSGNVFFNDAGTGQLYLRKDPFGSPATDHVSASQRTDCAEDATCGGDDEADPLPDLTLPATFQAATPDGEHAFFTSREELTDESNTTPPVDPPGIARVDLPDGGAAPPCDTEPCNVDKELLSLLSDAPAGVAADAEHLYWASPSTDSIGRSDLDGDNANAEFIPGADNPQDVTVDAGKIYWTNAANGEQGQGEIGRADLNGPGAASNVVQDCITGAWFPRGIDVEGSYAYWTNTTNKPYPPVGSLSTTSVGRADISGTCAAAEADANQHFKNDVANGDIAVTATHIYLSFQNPNGTGAVGFFNTVDGSPAGPAPGAFDITLGPVDVPVALAVDGSHLYWTHRDTDSTIGRANLDGSLVNDTFVTGLTAPSGITVGTGADAGHLYWSTIAVGGSRGKDLYRYDAGSGDLTDLTYAPGQDFGAEVRAVLGASDDGSRVYFVANADLDDGGPAAPGDCTGSNVGTTADAAFTGFSGQCSVYLWDEGETSFVARLDTGGGRAEQSDAANWIGAVEVERQARVSADGTLLFRSQQALTGYDNEGAQCETEVGQSKLQPGRCPEFYRYQADTGLSCVTCNPTGAQPSGPARLAEINFGVPTPGVPMRRLTRSLSADGNRVFFETPDKLVSGDVNGEGGCPQVLIGNTTGAATVGACLDVYMWEAEGVGSCQSTDENGGCLYLLSTGTGAEPSFLLDASSSGDDAFIFSRERLVPQDTDDLFDVYDANVDGGIASQQAVAPAQCEGDACRGAAANPSSGSAGAGPTTQSFQGSGNLRERAKPRRCPRGKRKVKRVGKVRCVKRGHRKRASANHKRAQRRTTNHNGRAGR